MTDQRITADADRGHDALKQLAGLITKLSYRDMLDFASKVWGTLPAAIDMTEQRMAEHLLLAAEEVLSS